MDEMRFKVNYRKKKSKENLEFYGEDALASHLKKNTVKAMATYPYGKVHFTDKLIVAPALGVIADYRDIVWMYQSGGSGEGAGARVKLVLCLENGEKELISGVTEAPLAEYFQLCRRYNPQMLIGTEHKKEKKAEYKDAVAHYEKWGANHSRPELTDWDGYGSPEGFYRREPERASSAAKQEASTFGRDSSAFGQERSAAGQDSSAFGRDSSAATSGASTARREPPRAKQPANMLNQMPYEPKPSAGALVPPSFKQMAFEDLPDAPEDLPSMSAEAPKPPSFKLDPELYIYLNYFPNQKIMAIKYYREATGVGLAEAKEEVEKIFHKYSRFPSDRIRVPSANARAAGGGNGSNSGSGYGGNAGNGNYGGNGGNSSYGRTGSGGYNGSGGGNGYGGNSGNSGGGIFAGQRPKVNARIVIGWILVVQAIFGFAVDAMIVLVMAGQYRKFLGVPGIASSFIAVGIQCVVYLFIGRLLIKSGKKKR